ncbi:hypothetical protein [Bordetella holmesii]|uniref:hypothetical protein n=1 Tax=Bordetella holmesii TaxID=35814 RepID=UPI000459529A|nr:hypothetical protein [Bordetella holmesii]KCV14599.1 hypothetical protein AZ25_2895 [Bordetella holmesii 04P3421]
MRVRTVAAVLTLFCATATGASAQDLMQVWRDALARDPIYAAARAAYRANNEKLPQAWRTWQPRVHTPIHSR